MKLGYTHTGRWIEVSDELANVVSDSGNFSGERLHALAARMATAQCDGPKRPSTAAEAKAYANGFALFQRIAPKAPAGWTATDSRKDPVITFICDSPLYKFTIWSFSRTFNRSQAEMQAIDAGVIRDQTAQFTMTYGETNIAMSNALQADAVCRGPGLSPGLPGEQR